MADFGDRPPGPRRSQELKEDRRAVMSDPEARALMCATPGRIRLEMIAPTGARAGSER